MLRGKCCHALLPPPLLLTYIPNPRPIPSLASPHHSWRSQDVRRRSQVGGGFRVPGNGPIITRPLAWPCSSSRRDPFRYISIRFVPFRSGPNTDPFWSGPFRSGPFRLSNQVRPVPIWPDSARTRVIGSCRRLVDRPQARRVHDAGTAGAPLSTGAAVQHGGPG
jgi:hypothetical protein